MSHEHAIYREQRLVLVRYGAPVDLASLISGTERLWADPLYDRNFDGIVDLSDPRLKMSSEDFRDYLGFLSGREEASLGRWASVATSPMAVAFGLLYQQAAAARHPFGIFASWSGACANLGLKPTAEMRAWMGRGQARPPEAAG